jgi:hypothetical protein
MRKYKFFGLFSPLDLCLPEPCRHASGPRQIGASTTRELRKRLPAPNVII